MEPKAAGNRGKGRPKGSVNRVPKALKDAILIAAENVGRVDVSTEYSESGREIRRRIATHDGGLVGFLEGLALDEPVAFASLLGKTLPKDINATVTQTLVITQERKAEALAGLMAALEKVRAPLLHEKPNHSDSERLH